MLYNSRRITRHYSKKLHIFCYNSPGADNCGFTNRYPFVNNTARPYPDIVSDSNLLNILLVSTIVLASLPETYG